jgi:pimeloyl-ACP methyl ester carboxylesterase
MIRRLMFAAAAIASIPAILGPQPAHAQQMGNAGLSGKFIQTPRIKVSIAGKGSPVILIPGLSSPGSVWEGVAPALMRNHKVYVVQVNGFAGDNPRDNLKPGVIAGLVADIHDLIVREKLKNVAVIGHSMGGLAALMLARDHPGDIAKLMVVDALPYVGEIFAPGATVAQMEPQAAMMRDQMLGLGDKPMPAAMADMQASRLALKPESRVLVSKWMQAANVKVTAQAFYEDMTIDLRPDMARIATPITLVYPFSAQLPKESAEAMYKSRYAAAPHVTLIGVNDSAHFIMLDQPDTFRVVVEAFAG